MECRTLWVPGLSAEEKQVTLLPAQLRRLSGRKRQPQLLAWQVRISKNRTLLITMGPGARGHRGAPVCRRLQRPAKPPRRTCGRSGVALGGQHMGPEWPTQGGGDGEPVLPRPPPRALNSRADSTPRGTLKDIMIPLQPSDRTKNHKCVKMTTHTTKTG